jgi:restriction endonuclease S subunit
VLDLPGGTFTGAGVKTVVLFFEKGSATKKVWFYQLNLDRNLGKTNALNEKDLADFVELQKTKAESENSWSIAVKDIDQSTFDLSAKNPNKKEEAALRQPQEILEEMKALDEESADILNSILELDMKQGWEIENATILLGKRAPSRARKLVRTNDVIFATVRPTHSRVALITEEYDEQVCSTGYFVLRGKDFIFNQYLFYFLLTDEFNEQMEKLQKGASYPAVTDAEIKSI